MNTCDLIVQISNGERIGSAEHLELKEDFKKIFYRDGYMAWRKKQESGTGGSYNKERNKLLKDFVATRADQIASEFVEDALQSVYELALEHLNARLYGVVDNFSAWKDDKDFPLKGSALKLYEQICEILESGEEAQKHRIILLLGVYAEGSLSQARKSLAGSGGELVLEALLQARGLKKDKDYGTQFTSEGSDTDMVIPNAKKPEDVKAYIAVQISSNDRTRLTTSELVPGQRNYFVSFNGCSASTKNTDDIGDEIVAKYVKEDILYVVTENERNRAIEASVKRLDNERNKRSPDKQKIAFGENRLKWLEEKSITFDEFVDQVSRL
ncbi:hypothetical protein BCU85_16595 [Vibrio lentus]|uniref:hypothetical protein n=1 Tax=Vibrio lentus TaxID=136468 RepID=UPI000C82C629|nr:hypothetical protein [Vibrio lentus]MCC4817045.1 hypothetical protein [Vibrio lentus]PMG73409.1 hypothetical protein BCU85_16595 [Vibrio lentus]PML21939.1 hypothetical protein BCT80_08105 [Vibrio lentus]PMM29238.1 hypothetical protein BCT57_00365 [Vibrio lentus]